MINSIDEAKKYLDEKNLTFCAFWDEKIYTSTKMGILPIITKMNENPLFFENAIIIDKVIGKAAAFLLSKSKVSKVYALLISEEGKNVLDQEKIDYEYLKIVSYIKNRDNTDMCPMEKSVLNIFDKDEAFSVLNKKIKK